MCIRDSFNGAPAIFIENRCLCVIPDAGNQLLNCEGELICNLGGFGLLGSGCDPSLADQLIDANIIWQPDCDCPCAFPFPVCGTDGNMYASDCEAACAGVEVDPEGACSELGGPIFDDYPWLLDIVNPNSCQSQAIREFDLGNHSFIYIFENANSGSLYLDDGTFYCEDRPNFDCLDAYGLRSNMITRTWSCSNNLETDATEEAEQRSGNPIASISEALTVFPNPTLGQFNIQINTASKEPQILTVVDLYGRILQEHTLQSDAPKRNISVDLSVEPDGLYMVVLKASGQAAIRKTVVKSGL